MVTLAVKTQILLGKRLANYRQMIFWLTGQPGSGKTTLGKALVEKLGNAFHIDGDNLRTISNNRDYTKPGRLINIRTAQSIAMYLDTNNQDVVVSLIAPYRWLREEFKERHEVNEIYLHTSTKRGRENYFVKNYEPPIDNYLDIDTTDLTVEESIDVIMENFIR